MSLSIPARAEQLLTRLPRIAGTYREPSGNTVAVERVLEEHLRRLGVDGFTIRVTADVARSRRAAIEASLKADTWLTPWRAAWRDARRDAWCAAPWRVVRRLADISARRAVALAAWTQLRETPSASEDLATDGSDWAGFASVLDWLSAQAVFDALEAARPSRRWFRGW